MIQSEATDGPIPPPGLHSPREYVPADAAGLLEVDRACAERGHGMVLDVDQVSSDLEEIRRRSAASELQRVFVVEDSNGRVAGFASVRKLYPARVRHVATLAVAVHPEYQRRGLGRALMRRAIAWGEAAGAIRLELYVRSDNQRAIALYRSLGFELEGVRRAFVRTLEGELIDDYIMARFAQPLSSPAS